MIRLAVLLMVVAGLAQAQTAPQSTPAPPVRPDIVVAGNESPTMRPRARWDERPRGALFTDATLAALGSHGAALAEVVPRDIAAWCPAYPDASGAERRAFWVGFISALAYYESRWRPEVVGGGGQFFGMMQIYPGTARGYGCRARSGEALKDAAANLSCTVRILARTVPRDRAISLREDRWGGVAADWGPMRHDWVRDEMQAWLRVQPYCGVVTAPESSPRPRARPVVAAIVPPVAEID